MKYLACLIRMHGVQSVESDYTANNQMQKTGASIASQGVELYPLLIWSVRRIKGQRATTPS
jgi:hypothetical protein